MKIEEIYTLLNEISPFDLQEKWDNSGLIVGSMQSEFEHIAVSIDIDEELIDTLAPKTVVIAHHPLIFSKLSVLDFSTYPVNLLQKMIQKDIFHIAMHTNFDKTHLNRYVLEEVLGYTMAAQSEFVAYFEVNDTLESVIVRCKERLGIQALRAVEAKTYIRKAALTTGSGASLITQIEADLFLTGDIKYHEAMVAYSLNMSLIDIGHFESERFFGKIVADELKKKQLSVIISSSKNPFTIF